MTDRRMSVSTDCGIVVGFTSH